VSVGQAARDLDLHENMLRRWAKKMAGDPAQAFPGNGQMKPEQLEIDRLRRVKLFEDAGAITGYRTVLDRRSGWA
jgi:hypothetical protein